MKCDVVFLETKKSIDELDLSDETKYKLKNILCKEIDEEFSNITICGKSIEEITTILNGLDIEKMLDIKMTMENLSYLFKKVVDEQNKMQQMAIKEMMFGSYKQ